MPDSAPVSYHVTTNLGYYVFVNGVKTFKNCLLIDGETTIKYMKSYDKITTIATGVTGASLSDDGDVLYYILEPAGLLCPWVFPGNNTEVFQEIFLTQGLNLHLLCLLHG